MKKITRSGLKSVVKECLIEILSEGISNTQVSSLSESRTRRYDGSHTQSSSRRNSSRRPSLDNISYNERQTPPEPSPFDQKVTSAVSNITNDAVLSSLLEDTARTTLQEQMHAESSRGPTQAQGDSAARAVANSDPLDLFGGAANNWAELAFAPSKNRP